MLSSKFLLKTHRLMYIKKFDREIFIRREICYLHFIEFNDVFNLLPKSFYFYILIKIYGYYLYCLIEGV